MANEVIETASPGVESGEQRDTPKPPAAAERTWTAKQINILRNVCEVRGLPPETAMSAMGVSGSMEDALVYLQDKRAESEPKRKPPTVQVLRDEGDTIRRSVESQILHRFNRSAYKLESGGEQWNGMTLNEIVREYVRATQGVVLRGQSRVDMAHIALGLTRASGMASTTDFPLLLANSASKRLRDSYAAVRQSWRPIARKNNAPDLKERSIVTLSGMPDFKKVAEGAEYTYAKFGESSEKYALAKYGRAIAFTEEMMINDDLGAFDRLLTHFGRAASNVESDLVWGVITANAAMGDTVALFNSAHGNLAGSGAALSETTMEAGEIAMAKQKDASGKEMNLRPKYFASAAKHRVTALKLFASVVATKTGDVNVYQNAVEVLTEQRLDGSPAPWYLFADPDEFDTIEYAYLDGEEGVKTSTRIGFEVDGLEIKGRLFFAAKALDYRGMYKNPGT